MIRRVLEHLGRIEQRRATGTRRRGRLRRRGLVRAVQRDAIVTAATVQRTAPAAGPQHETGTISPVPPRAGPLDSAGIDAVMAHLEAMPIWATRPPSRLRQRLDGARRVLNWLAGQPGPGWQARWIAAGSDAGTSWMGALAANLGSRRPPGGRS